MKTYVIIMSGDNMAVHEKQLRQMVADPTIAGSVKVAYVKEYDDIEDPPYNQRVVKGGM